MFLFEIQIDEQLSNEKEEQLDSNSIVFRHRKPNIYRDDIKARKRRRKFRISKKLFIPRFCDEICIILFDRCSVWKS